MRSRCRLRRPRAGNRPAPAPARPLPTPLQSSWAPRLGHSLADIRIHADDAARARAEARGAVAFTVGRDIFVDRDRVPASAQRAVLAHEVAHAAQQGLRHGSEHTAPTVRSQPHEADADRVAGDLLGGRPTRPRAAAPLSAHLLSPARFQRDLGSTDAQRLAVDTLFVRPGFDALWTWMGGCAATPAQDLGPLELRVTPGLTSGGIVRFGGYHPVTRTLEINPTKPEHVDNPAELVDTVFHELIHAAHDLDGACRAAGSTPAPLSGAATSTLPGRAAVSPIAEAVFNVMQGPGASDPCGEFIDINAAAQRMVVDAVQSNVQLTGTGRPTLTFVNTIIRSDPAALSSYETCRVAACARTGTARTSALSTCSTETIARFLPAARLSALLPAHVQFDSGSAALRADQQSKLDLVARFLVHHPTRTVDLVGHTDRVGTGSDNVTLGQARADTIKAELLARGVPAAQIRGATSRGEAATLSSSTAQRWRDRRVEILP